MYGETEKSCESDSTDEFDNYLFFISPFDVFCVTQVMSLAMLFSVEEDHNGRHEVHDFACGQQVQVGPGVPPSVAVNPLKLGLEVWRWGHLGQGVRLDHGSRSEELNGTSSHEHLHVALVGIVRGILGAVTVGIAVGAVEVALRAKGRPHEVVHGTSLQPARDNLASGSRGLISEVARRAPLVLGSA